MRIHFEHVEYVHCQPSQSPSAIQIAATCKPQGDKQLGDGLAFYVTQAQARVLIEELGGVLKQLEEMGFAER